MAKSLERDSQLESFRASGMSELVIEVNTTPSPGREVALTHGFDQASAQSPTFALCPDGKMVDDLRQD